MPEPASWAHLEGLARVEAALTVLYGYYRRTERMWTVSYRDEADVEALREPMQGIRAYLDGVRDDLASHLVAPTGAADRIRATLGSAVQFSTWQSLAREAMADRAMADLVCDWLRGTIESRPAADGAVNF